MPRIYAACLASYNDGQLHGAWIDAAQDPEDIHASITQMLRRSRRPDAEEWAIHDYEGFGTLKLGEHPAIERVAEFAHAIEEHGDAFASWAGYVGENYANVSDFEDAYHGEHDSQRAFTEELLEDMGWLSDMPEHLRSYFDYDTYTRDLFITDFFSSAAPGGGVFVFRND